MQITDLRYSRVQLCATKAGHVYGPNVCDVTDDQDEHSLESVQHVD